MPAGRLTALTPGRESHLWRPQHWWRQFDGGGRPDAGRLSQPVRPHLRRAVEWRLHGPANEHGARAREYRSRLHRCRLQLRHATPDSQRGALHLRREYVGGAGERHVEPGRRPSSTAVPLMSDTWITGNPNQPVRPVHRRHMQPESPKRGNATELGEAPCISTNSDGLTRDCPSGGTHVGAIAVTLSPLTTAPVTHTAPDGKFCAGQDDTSGLPGHQGCFGTDPQGTGPLCTTITEIGVPAGPLLRHACDRHPGVRLLHSGRPRCRWRHHQRRRRPARTWGGPCPGRSRSIRGLDSLKTLCPAP